MLPFVTLILSFLSLLGAVQVGRLFGVTPAQLHDPTRVLDGSTLLLALAIMLAPIAITCFMQKVVHREPLASLEFGSTKGRFFWSALGVGILGKSLATAAAYLISPAARVARAIPQHEAFVGPVAAHHFLKKGARN